MPVEDIKLKQARASTSPTTKRVVNVPISNSTADYSGDASRPLIPQVNADSSPRSFRKSNGGIQTSPPKSDRASKTRYAVVPETTPPDAKVLPVPLFVKAQFPSQNAAAREIKDMLRIL